MSYEHSCPTSADPTMFGFGKPKSENAIEPDDDGDIYRPQPVYRPRLWSTKSDTPPEYQQHSIHSQPVINGPMLPMNQFVSLGGPALPQSKTSGIDNMNMFGGGQPQYEFAMSNEQDQLRSAAEFGTLLCNLCVSLFTLAI